MDQYLELSTPPIVGATNIAAHSLQYSDTPSLMKKCRGASWLISKQLDGALSIRESIQLHTHLMVCRDCRQCLQQFTMLHQLGDKFMAAPHSGNAGKRRQQAVIERAMLQIQRDPEALTETEPATPDCQ